MPLPSTGTISLDMIRTEFGGANPISLSQYYRGGGRVPDIAANINIPLSGTISFSNFYGATNVVLLQLGASGVTYVSSGEDFAGTQINLFRDGTWSVEAADSGTPLSGDWASPKSATIGDGYWVRFIVQSVNQQFGSVSWTATTGWLQLNATRSAFVSTSGNAAVSVTYEIEIATNSSGANAVVVATGVRLEASSVAGGGGNLQ